MPLEVNHVASSLGIWSTEKMVEADFIKARKGCIARDMSANPVFALVCSDNHRHCIPPDQALNPSFDFAITRISGLLSGWNGINIRSGGSERDCYSLTSGVNLKIVEKLNDPFRAAFMKHIVQGFQPLLRFNRF